MDVCKHSLVILLVSLTPGVLSALVSTRRVHYTTTTPMQLTWCYNQTWCREWPSRVTADRSTWPTDVISVRFLPPNHDEASLDKIARHLITDQESDEDHAAMEEILAQIALHLPYPLTKRKRPNFQVGHRRNGVVQSDAGREYPKDMVMPAFVEPSWDIDVLAGEDITLSCKLQNQGTFKLVWVWNNRVVAYEKHVSQNFHTDGKGMLTYKQINETGVAHGSCGVGDVKGMEQNFSVDVIAPARFHYSKPFKRDIPLAWHSCYRLTCSVSGNPRPIVWWIKRGRPSVLSTGSEYKIAKATRDQAGLYMCYAYNGVGSRLTETFRVTVEYPPEISCTDEPSYESTLYLRDVVITCEIDALPLANMASIHGPLFPLGSTVMMDGSEENRTTLFDGHRLESYYLGDHITVRFIIRNFSVDDIGIYSIQVKNAVNKTILAYSLSDHARAVEFATPDESPRNTSADVSLQYVSNLPPIASRILYRENHSSNLIFMYDSQGILVSPPWGDEVYSTTTRTRQQEFDEGLDGWREITRNGRYEDHLFFTLENLKPGTDYEVLAQIKNEKGWSPHGGPFRFTTVRHTDSYTDENVSASTSAGGCMAPPVLALLLAFCVLTS